MGVRYKQRFDDTLGVDPTIKDYHGFFSLGSGGGQGGDSPPIPPTNGYLLTACDGSGDIETLTDLSSVSGLYIVIENGKTYLVTPANVAGGGTDVAGYFVVPNCGYIPPTDCSRITAPFSEFRLKITWNDDVQCLSPQDFEAVIPVAVGTWPAAYTEWRFSIQPGQYGSPYNIDGFIYCDGAWIRSNITVHTGIGVGNYYHDELLAFTNANIVPDGTVNHLAGIGVRETFVNSAGTPAIVICGNVTNVTGYSRLILL